MNALELLLKKETTNLPESTIKHKRLSKECGEDVVFELRGLPYDISHEISTLHQDDVNVHTVLAGVIEPNLKEVELMKNYNAVTPVELIKKLFLHGEVVGMAREIERLTGYRTSTFEMVDEVKKK